MLEGSNEMRFATMENMFRAARYPVKTWNKDAAGIEDVSKIGLKGSPTLVSKVFAPKPKTVKAELIDTESHEPRDIALTLVSKLFTQHPKLHDSIVKRAA